MVFGMAQKMQPAELQVLILKGQGSAWDSRCPACTVRDLAGDTQPVACPGRNSPACRRLLLCFTAAPHEHLCIRNNLDLASAVHLFHCGSKQTLCFSNLI